MLRRPLSITSSWRRKGRILGCWVLTWLMATERRAWPCHTSEACLDLWRKEGEEVVSGQVPSQPQASQAPALPGSDLRSLLSSQENAPSCPSPSRVPAGRRTLRLHKVPPVEKRDIFFASRL